VTVAAAVIEAAGFAGCGLQLVHPSAVSSKAVAETPEVE